MAILEAARDILATRGVDGLSMRQVAEQVGVSATAIYHYFAGKQDLVNRVILSAFERFGAYLKAAMASHPEGSVERIAALGEAYIRFALENQAYFRVMFSISPEDRASLEELPDAGGYHLLRNAVADAMQAGTVRELNDEFEEIIGSGTTHNGRPDVVSMYLWSTVHGLVTLALCGAADHCHVAGMPSVLDLYKAFYPLFADGVAAAEVGDQVQNESGDSQ
jgi:AcrR family transcriptional regulator